MSSENNRIKLSHALLDTPSQVKDSKAELLSCWNSLGLYHSTQYVLRLSYSIHKLVDSATQKKNKDITWEEIQAYSTYIHETVHWWQHIGSTIGFIMSMCYPSEAHSNLKSLKHLANSERAMKPLMAWAETEMLSGKDHTDPDIAAANNAINNTLDIAFYRTLIMGTGDLEKIAQNNYFESTAHSFRIAYDTTINTLRAVFDPDAKFLPNPDKCHLEFKQLENEKVTGHYYGSPIYKYPIRGLDIIEGQARFIQLQFLSFATNRKLTVQQAEKEGYLRGEYGNAYRFFLENTHSNPPDLIDSPLIALFLLICDIALNPLEGFPKSISNTERFIHSSNSSYRFMALCNAAKENPQIKQHIQEYNKKEYLEVAQILTSYCGLEHPYEIPTLIKEWKEKNKQVQDLLEQQETFKYPKDNIVIRVIFSHFLAFNIDKHESPEFFCWAGKHLASKENRDNTEKMWLRNLSLYTDNAEEQTIVPRLFPGKPEENIKNTFNQFYAANIIYSIGSQWVMETGPFKYDFSWLTEREESEAIEKKTKELFEKLYNVSPDNIRYQGKT